MDSTAYLKNNLISRIQNSTDLNFLKALQTIFDSTEQELFQLSKEQEKAIELGKAEIQSGKSQTNEQVIQGAKEWLKNQ